LNKEKKDKIKEILEFVDKTDIDKIDNKDIYIMNKYRLIDEQDDREEEQMQCRQQ